MKGKDKDEEFGVSNTATYSRNKIFGLCLQAAQMQKSLSHPPSSNRVAPPPQSPQPSDVIPQGRTPAHEAPVIKSEDEDEKYSDVSNTATHPRQLRAEKILAPLARKWVSSRRGEVCALELPLLLPRQEFSTEEIAILRFTWASGCGVARVLSKSVVFWGLCEDGPLQWKMCPKKSNHKGGPIVWKLVTDENVIDVWHGKLVDVACAAHSWLSARSIITNPQRCLTSELAQSETSHGQFRIGFCTTVKNRLWQLERALPLNLMSNWRHRRWVRFHVVDFGSTDGACDFIYEHCSAALEAGLLHLYVSELEHFHASIAKNTAHMVASEEILVNLDCDNLVDEEFAPKVRRMFEENSVRALRFRGGQGVCGRIAYLRKNFMQFGGYDEEAYPFGAQDIDIYDRLKQHYGKNAVRIAEGIDALAIPNTREDKMRLVDPQLGLNWNQMDQRNRQVFKKRLDAGQLFRNAGRTRGVPVTRVFESVSSPGPLAQDQPLRLRWQ